MRNILRWVLRKLIDVIAHVEIRGAENLPKEGAFVIATNHLGMLDVTLLYYSIDRWDVFVPVAEKWEKLGILRWLGRHLNWIFIDRFNPDLKAMRAMIALMQQGHTLVIAPEGTRSRVGSMIEGKAGAGYLAARLHRPIVPIGLAGTEDPSVFSNLRRLRRSRILINAGKPFVLPPIPHKDREAALQQYTTEIMCRIAALIPEKYRGVYAQHPRLKELLAAD